MTTPVSISITIHGDVPVARVEGEIDLSNIGEVHSAVAAAVTNATRAFVVDLSGTTYLDSRGVHFLFELAERMARSQQRFSVVVPAGAPIRKLLVLTHLDQVVPIHESLADAVGPLGGSGGM